MNKDVVLLVEDDPDDEAVALCAFKVTPIDIKVVVARDGVEALDYLFGTGKYADRDISEMPRVVLLDLKLPKVDGLEVLKRIRSDDRTKRLPVVILTSSDEEKDAVESYNLGANSYIRKPVDYEQFTKAVQELKLYWLDINKPPPGDTLGT